MRRRSGGGAVLVGPGQAVWIDVVVPAGDPLWADDVGRAGWWLGEVWAAALAAAGLPGGEVWRGAQVRSAWSDRVCFAGLGAGEVTVGGRKVVGISQRRTRAGRTVPVRGADHVGPGAAARRAAVAPGRAGRGPRPTWRARRPASGRTEPRPLVRRLLDRLP